HIGLAQPQLTNAVCTALVTSLVLRSSRTASGFCTLSLHDALPICTKGKYLLYGRNLPGGTPAKDLAVDGKPLEQLKVEIELPREDRKSTRLNSSHVAIPYACFSSKKKTAP